MAFYQSSQNPFGPRQAIYQSSQNPFGSLQAMQTHPQQQAAAWQMPQTLGARQPQQQPAQGMGLLQQQQLGQQNSQNPVLAPTPQQWQPPQLPKPMSLAEMVAPENTFQFQSLPMGAQNWQRPPGPAPVSGDAGAEGGRTGQETASVQSGINMPSPVPQPIPGPQPASPAWMGGPAAGGLAAALRDTLAPQAMQAMGQWHQNNAGMDNAYQQAQAQSGLGWGSLANQANNAAIRNGVQNQGSILNFLAGMGWM